MLPKRTLIAVFLLFLSFAQANTVSYTANFPDGAGDAVSFATDANAGYLVTIRPPQSGSAESNYAEIFTAPAGTTDTSNKSSWVDWGRSFIPGNAPYWQSYSNQVQVTGGVSSNFVLVVANSTGASATAYSYENIYTTDGIAFSLTGGQTYSNLLKFTFVSTSLSPQPVSVACGGTTITSGTIQPYTTLTLTGTATGALNASITANSGTTLVPYTNYDPASISQGGREIDRTYYVGTDPANMINCTLTFVVGNSTTTGSAVSILAGSLPVASGTSSPLPASTSPIFYQTFKATLPLPVGATVGVNSQNHMTLEQSPASAVISASNYDLLWVGLIDNGTPAAPTTTLAGGAQLTITTDANGNPQNVTVYMPGTSSSPSSSTSVVNVPNTANNGQAVQAPTLSSGIISGGTQPTPASGGTPVTITSGGNTGWGPQDSANLAAVRQSTQATAAALTPANGMTDYSPPSNGSLTPFTPDLSALSGLNLLNGYTVPAATAPVLTLPFAMVHPSLPNATFDFSQGTPNTLATAVRAFFLFIVSIYFALHHLRLVSRTFGL